MALNYRTALRTKVVAILRDALGAGVLVAYRPTRRLVSLPAVTYSDSGVRADDMVPLDRRTFTLDVWTRNGLDDAETLCQAVITALDRQPIPLVGDEGLVGHCVLAVDDDVPQYDADLDRKQLKFTMWVYDYNAPLPFTIPVKAITPATGSLTIQGQGTG
jgi:hypothetical protein